MLYIFLDANENKAHPDHIQADSNGFPVANGRIHSSPVHKTSRLNGVVPRMNITPNPMAPDGDKVFKPHETFHGARLQRIH